MAERAIKISRAAPGRRGRTLAFGLVLLMGLGLARVEAGLADLGNVSFHGTLRLYKGVQTVPCLGRLSDGCMTATSSGRVAGVDDNGIPYSIQFLKVPMQVGMLCQRFRVTARTCFGYGGFRSTVSQTTGTFGGIDDGLEVEVTFDLLSCDDSYGAFYCWLGDAFLTVVRNGVTLLSPRRLIATGTAVKQPLRPGGTTGKFSVHGDLILSRAL